MSEYAPLYEPDKSPPADSKTGLWVALLGAAACLILAIIVLSFAGLGWLTYTREQDENATATTQAQNDDATATAAAQIVLAPPEWSLITTDEFASNDNEWKVGSIEGTYSNLVLSIEDGIYRWQAKANPQGMVNWVVPYARPYYPWYDFYLSADCQQINDSVTDFYCGLLFHFTDSDNVYEFVVAKDQSMRIMAEKSDQDISILPWTHTELIHSGKRNRLAILAEGTHYQFFINNQPAYEFDDNRLTGGTLGLVAGLYGEDDAEFHFDNFQLYQPER